jgi:hypothetical protein
VADPRDGWAPQTTAAREPLAIAPTTTIWWTYYNGCKWSAELTLGTLSSQWDPQATQGTPGLVLITADNVTWNGIIETRSIQASLFTAPPAPITLPRECLVIRP